MSKIQISFSETCKPKKSACLLEKNGFRMNSGKGEGITVTGDGYFAYPRYGADDK